MHLTLNCIAFRIGKHLGELIFGNIYGLLCRGRRVSFRLLENGTETIEEEVGNQAIGFSSIIDTFDVNCRLLCLDGRMLSI